MDQVIFDWNKGLVNFMNESVFTSYIKDFERVGLQELSAKILQASSDGNWEDLRATLKVLEAECSKIGALRCQELARILLLQNSQDRKAKVEMLVEHIKELKECLRKAHPKKIRLIPFFREELVSSDDPFSPGNRSKDRILPQRIEIKPAENEEEEVEALSRKRVIPPKFHPPKSPVYNEEDQIVDETIHYTCLVF